MVFNFVPRLPQHPGFNSKLTNRSDLFSRSPRCPHRVNASQVSVSDLLHSTDVSRYEFYSSTLMAGCVDPTETFGDVWRWLRGLGTFQVSPFVFSR